MKSLIACALALCVPSLLILVPTASAEYDRETALVLAIRKAKPSIVSIKVERQGNWGKKEGLGTGVVIDERGYAITNRHVIANALKIQATLPDKTEVNCQLLVEDASNDLAILKLPAGKKYKSLTLGPGSDLMEGETVIAIGNPFGFSNTISTGIISSLDREIVMPGEVRLTRLIQHSACINPGNSGGPLINVNGELIGINVALREGAQAIGFAINSDTVKRVVSKHLSALKMSRVEHGLTCNEVVQRRGENRQKVLVEQVSGNSPAAEAGLKSGDVLLKLGDREVANRFDVERAFWDYKPGDKIAAVVMRNGQPTAVAVTLNRGSDIVAASSEATRSQSQTASRR